MPEIFNDNAAPRVWALIKQRYSELDNPVDMPSYVRVRLDEMRADRQISDLVHRQVLNIANTLIRFEMTHEDQSWLWEMLAVCRSCPQYILGPEELDQLKRIAVALLLEDRMTPDLGGRLTLMLAEQCERRNRS